MEAEIQPATPPLEDNEGIEESGHNGEAAISSSLEGEDGDSSQPPTISAKLLRMLEAATNWRPALVPVQTSDEVFDANDGAVSEAPRTKRVSATGAEQVLLQCMFNVVHYVVRKD